MLNKLINKEWASDGGGPNSQGTPQESTSPPRHFQLCSFY